MSPGFIYFIKVVLINVFFYLHFFYLEAIIVCWPYYFIIEAKRCSTVSLKSKKITSKFFEKYSHSRVP